MARGVALPMTVLLVLGRATKSAAAAGWLAPFLLTLPVQVLGQLGWCAAEAAAYLHRAIGSRNRK